jgi:hypothetical protein
MLRQVRVFKDNDDLIVSRPGRLSGVLPETTEGGADDWTQMGGEAEEEEPEMQVEA